MILDLGGAYMTVPYFDAGVALEMLGREKATIAYPSFVTIMQDLITHPTFGDTDLSSLRIMNSNFAVQPAWIKDAVTAAMPHTIQVGTYGLTEGAGTVSTSRLDNSFEQRTGRCGEVLDEWEMRIVDVESGRDCAPGEHGEIVIRGPNMLKGYYNAPEKTAEVMRDGWFHTGDIGSMDADGQVMFRGRTKDMLKVGGENVAAAEIEAMLQSHPAVKLAQVVGIPDDRYSEVPAAFVELVDGSQTTTQELIDHCKGKVASFKVPRHVRIVDQWPMSTSKIQKFRLQKALVAELGLA
jgi:fatty-acyl-CoA synthase